MIKNWVQALGLCFLRVTFGTLMLAGHGLDKLLHFGTYVSGFPNPLGLGSFLTLSLAIFAEFFCCVLIILGIGTRIATVPVIITMLVAGVMHHAADPWKSRELAFAYLAAFITIFICGGGAFSLDWALRRWLKRSRKSPEVPS